MRILIASPNLPWPLDAGGNVAQFSMLKCLERDHDFTLVCPAYTPADAANARRLRSELPGVRVRSVDCGAPARKPRIHQVARYIARAGRRLLRSVSHNSGVQPPALYYPFNPLPEPYIAALREEIDRGVDLCQVEFAEMLPLGTWLPEDLPRLFIHHQIHFVYAERFLETHQDRVYSEYLLSIIKSQEIEYLRRYDGVVVFSEPDRKNLSSYVEPARLFTNPFPTPEAAGNSAGHSGFNGRYVFLGSQIHGPNVDALEWLLADIWPAIQKQLPSSRLTVIGNWDKGYRAQYASPGVRFTGYVDDLAEAMAGGVMLVPVRIGSGIRTKILVAMAQGIPVVSTSVGSEGLLVEDQKELLIRDHGAEFARAAVQLALQPGLYRQLVADAKETVFKYYSPESARRRRNEIYAALRQRDLAAA